MQHGPPFHILIQKLHPVFTPQNPKSGSSVVCIVCTAHFCLYFLGAPSISAFCLALYHNVLPIIEQDFDALCNSSFTPHNHLLGRYYSHFANEEIEIQYY